MLGLSRFLGLGAWGLWIDEAHTLNDALWFFRRTPQDYPLGYLATRAVVALRGGATDEATLRLFPALCGWLSLPLAAWAFRPVIGPLRSSATAFLMAISSWHLFWSQSARAYTLMLVLALLGTGLWLRGLREDRRSLLVLGLALGAASAFSHPSGALLLPAWVLAPLVTSRLGSLRPPWLPPTRFLLALSLAGALALGGWTLGVWSTYESVKSGGSPKHFLSTVGWYMTPLYLLGAAAGLGLALRRRDGEELTAGLMALIAGSLALAASTRVTVSAQYVLALFPFVAALATGPLVHLRGTALRTAWIALLAVHPLVDTGLYFGLRHGDRPRWRAAYAYVWEQRGPDDLVLGMHAPVGEYYLNPGATWLRTQEAMEKLDPFTFASGAVRPWLRRERPIWVVLAPGDLAAWSAPDRAQLELLLQQSGELRATYSVPYTPRDMEVRVYRVGPDA